MAWDKDANIEYKSNVTVGAPSLLSLGTIFLKWRWLVPFHRMCKELSTNQRLIITYMHWPLCLLMCLYAMC